MTNISSLIGAFFFHATLWRPVRCEPFVGASFIGAALRSSRLGQSFLGPSFVGAALVNAALFGRRNTGP